MGRLSADLGPSLDISGAVDRAARTVVGARPDFELRAGPFVRNELQVVTVKGREEMSRCFRFDVLVATPEPDLVVEALVLGQPATLSMRGAYEDDRRVVQGIVASVQAEGQSPEVGQTCFRLSIVPKLWLLKKKSRSRMFQGKTVPEIISTVLAATGIDHAWRTTHSYDPREYCLQYQETDYDFIARLCADEGIFFYFQHPSALLDAATAGLGSQVAAVAGAVASAVGAGDALASKTGSAGLTERLLFGDSATYPASGAGGLSVGASLGAALDGTISKSLTSEEGLFAGPGPELKHRPVADLVLEADVVTDFRLRRTIRSKSVLVTDYDFKRPQFQVQARATMKRLEVSAGVSPEGLALCLDGHLSAGVGVGIDVEMPPLGYDPARIGIHDHDGSQDATADEDDARRYLEQVRRRSLVGRGASWCPHLSPGHRFSIVEHAHPGLDMEYVCTRVVHSVKRGVAGLQSLAYENTFQCVPADRKYRPPRDPRKVNQVLETAVVVGPPGEEIHVDAFGRIKVHFHWDLDGAKDDTSPCWIRVAQAWAGAASVQFIPRVGMEVLVSFIAGDTDRPVVVGCLYNAVNPPPYPLPTEKTRSGIRTRSMGGDGYNEIVFEDQKGSEYIGIRSQRDLRVDVGNDHEVIVGNGALGGQGSQSVAIGLDQTVLVGGEQRVDVGGNRRTTVSGDSFEKVHHDARVQVKGDVYEELGGCRYESIEETHRYEAGAGLVERITGDRQTRVTGDHPLTVQGQHTLTVGQDVVCSAGEDFAVTVGRSLSFDSVESIRLVCGESTIELRPKEIVISSPKISAVTTDTLGLFAKDSSLTLSQEKVAIAAKTEAKIGAKRVALHGKDTTVTLADGKTGIAAKDTVAIAGEKKVSLKGQKAGAEPGSDAKIKGGTVTLFGSEGGIKLQDSADADADEAYEETKPDKLDTSWVELELTQTIAKGGDPKNKVDVPVPGARYVVEAGGKTYYGVLDGKGRAHVPIRPGSAKVSFPDYDGDAVQKA